MNTESLLEELTAQLVQLRNAAPPPLRRIRAQVGQTLRLFSVAAIHLKGRKELLPVSRNQVHLFRQM